MNQSILSSVSPTSSVESIDAKHALQPELIGRGPDGLSFDRRGRGTTGARGSDRLSIQHDLGTSDTHVVGIHMSGLSVTVIYADTHRSRAALLQRVLEPYAAPRKTKPEATCARCELHAGRYASQKPSDLEHYLNFFGSRLVFPIDRHCARKQLERFVKRADAIVLLKWAADDNIGQCAFLQEGDINLICTAVERAKPAQRRLAVRLDELLRCDSARTFLMTVLAIVSIGLTNHESLRLINDDIEAALLQHLESTDQAVLTAAADHAVLVLALLDRIRGAILRLKGEARDGAATAHVADVWEQRASDIARRSSRLLEQTNHNGNLHLHPLLTEAGAVAEVLEQAAFKLAFMPKQPDPRGVALLGDLAEFVAHGAREYVHCLASARDIRCSPALTRSRLERFLTTVARLADLEDRAAATACGLDETLMQSGADVQQLHVPSEIGRAFRLASASLARSSLVVRDYVFSTTSGDI